MESPITIHKDFYKDIQIILSAVTELIAEAILRSAEEQDDQDPAA